MSGIVALLGMDGAPVDAQILRRMTEYLRFCVSDALATNTDGPVGLGHALFRTTNESANDRQPFTLNGEVWITADARIDDRTGLIGSLDEHDPPLQGAADAELILRAYRKWGDGCLEHLLGDFAFIIWDRPAQRLFCARDHLGVKPFYYARRGNVFLATNTLECLRLHPAITENLNEQAIGDFLLFGYNRETDTTAFADVARLPPAHTLTITADRVALRRFWALPQGEPAHYRNEQDCLDHFRQLLHAAVSDRLRTKRVSIFMSGGLDSTSVAAVAQQHMATAYAGDAGAGVHAFTVVFDNLFADEEGRVAAEAAAALGIPIRCVALPNYDLYRNRDRSELRRPEPAHEPLAAFENEFYAQATGYSRVALTGEGGDVLLHSQSGPYMMYLLKRMKFMRLAKEVGGHVLKHGRIPPPLAGFRSGWRRMLGTNAEAQIPAWLEPMFAQRLDLEHRWKAFAHPSGARHAFRPAAHAALNGNFFPALFESQDPGVTRIPLEIRMPLLDVRLVGWALSLPPLPWCVDKALLRTSMCGILPEEIRLRPKTPLRRDPIVAILERGGFRAEQFRACAELAQFVVPGKLASARAEPDPNKVAAALRAISLNYWLRDMRQHRSKANRDRVPESRE